MKTKQQITMVFGADHPAMGHARYTITIPAGTRVKPTGDGQFFVDDLSWIGAGEHGLRHDAEHYGIRLNADQVTEPTRTGTSHFVSQAAAEHYYAEYGYDDVRAAVARKITEGEIHIGKPSLKAGERLLTIDNGTRYAIES